jgi:hypothetical protein
MLVAGMSIRVTFKDGVFESLEEVTGVHPGQHYTVFSDEELDDIRGTLDTVLSPVADDEDDDLSDAERRALHEALSTSWKSAEAGHLRPGSATLNELRQRR